jgi:hypothetical protein
VTDDIQFANVGEEYESPLTPMGSLGPQDQAVIAELEAAAQAAMDADSQDPSKQMYFFRLDRREVVKDEKEYNWCIANQIPLKVIPYGAALQALKEEDARHRQRLKVKRKKKAAKQARKRNR